MSPSLGFILWVYAKTEDSRATIYIQLLFPVFLKIILTGINYSYVVKRKPALCGLFVVGFSYALTSDMVVFFFLLYSYEITAGVGASYSGGATAHAIV